MICTSTLLRASTSLSAGFALASQRSPPFGSTSRRSAGCARPGGAPLSLRPRLCGRGLAAHRNSLIRVSRRAAGRDVLGGPGVSQSRPALLDDSLASFERPRGAAFQLSLTLLAALSDSGPYPALGGWHPPFALHAQAALLRQRRAGGRRALTVSRRPFQAARPRAAHALNLGPGSAPFARRYSGHRVCFLFLGLLICLSSARRPTMQRASHWSPRADAVRPSQGVPLCIVWGSPPLIRKVTIRIGLRLAATNLAPCYVLRRRPSPVVHCRPLIVPYEY